MTTGWHISIGYLSGYTYSGDADEAFGELVKATEKLCAHPERIAVEALLFGAPDSDDGYALFDFCKSYRQPWTDATIWIDREHQQIIQMASGDRLLKEHVRRAFCRLLIADMHRKGIEVNLHVV